MKTREQIIEELSSAQSAKEVYSVRVPYDSGAVMTFDKTMMDLAMKSWDGVPERDRERLLHSIKKHIRKDVKRISAGQAPQRSADEFASEVALWFAHEVLFADGEKHMIATPDINEMVRQ